MHSSDFSSKENRPVLLVVSFGTSYQDSRVKTIEAVERALAAEFPAFEVRRAFTSRRIIKKLKERDGLEIDYVTDAIQKLIREGVKEVVVQPTHMMPGYEYDELVAGVEAYRPSFDRLVIGVPVLHEEADYRAVAACLEEQTRAFCDDRTVIVWMGHGTEHPANCAYSRMQQVMQQAGMKRHLVATVEAEPTVDEIIEKARAMGASRAVLLPMMIVAGDHANNDMAGEQEDSWKSKFEAAGFQVECVLQGIGQYPEIHQLMKQHAAKAIQRLDEKC